MSVSTRTPAQAAKAGGQGRPPASPPSSTSSSQSGAAAEREAPAGQGPRNTEPGSRAPSGRGTAKPRCGAKARQTGQPCRNGRGQKTDHPGTGRCYLHGGSTPMGKKGAAREKVMATLEALAIPVDGDPLEVLQASVAAAHGVLLASRELVKAGATDITLKYYLDGIERAAKVAKAAAEAINLDEMVRIREREADLLEVALTRTLERSGLGARKRADFISMFREELRAVLPSAEELS